MQSKGVNRVPPKAMAAASAAPLNFAIYIVPAAPVVSELPPVPALQLPVKKPVARALPADFFPLRVESPTPMRIPVPSRASCRGKSLFGGLCKQVALYDRPTGLRGVQQKVALGVPLEGTCIDTT
jgi:hypothetical protein